jgi:hypothetical protein
LVSLDKNLKNFYIPSGLLNSIRITERVALFDDRFIDTQEVKNSAFYTYSWHTAWPNVHRSICGIDGYWTARTWTSASVCWNIVKQQVSASTKLP